MPTQTRLYLVVDGDKKSLVRAPNPAQAIRHVARRITAEVASQDDIVSLVSSGVKPETAGEEA